MGHFGHFGQNSHFGHFGQPFPNQGGRAEKKFHLGSCLHQRDRATFKFSGVHTHRKPRKKYTAEGVSFSRAPPWPFQNWFLPAGAQATTTRTPSAAALQRTFQRMAASRRAQSTSLLGALAAGSSADPPPRATAQTLQDSTSDEVMVMRAPLVVSVVIRCCFRVSTSTRSSERFPTAPHNPVRRRSAGSCAPIDHMLTTFGLWVFVGTVPARDLMSPCHDDYTVD